MKLSGIINRLKDFPRPSEQVTRLIVIGLELLALTILIYIITLPFYPVLQYKFGQKQTLTAKDQSPGAIEEAIQKNKEANADEYSKHPNRIFIPKIGVNAPIIVTDNEKYGLSQGAWLYPEGSTPDKGGNTIITAHRFKYLPPNNLTFYLIDKLFPGDIITVLWHNKYYHYKVNNTKIVDKHEVSILKNTSRPILTIFSCHPVYSTKNRFVVISDLLPEDKISHD